MFWFLGFNIKTSHKGFEDNMCFESTVYLFYQKSGESLPSFYYDDLLIN